MNLYPGTLLDWPVYSSSFFFFSPSICQISRKIFIYVPLNKDSFTSLFSIRMPFLSLSCLIQWLEPLAEFQTKVMRVDIFVLFLIFEGKKFSLSPLTMMLAGNFSLMLFISLREFPLFLHYWELWFGLGFRFKDCFCA